MVTKQEVENFLKEFKGKMKIWDVLFRSDRDSNIQALADLDIRPIDRKKILENLKATDYSEGPLEEKLHGGSNMWVFGKDINKQRVYIKISIGFHNRQVICISFHRAKYTMNLPFKTHKNEKPLHR
jgi:hypothetical protein